MQRALNRYHLLLSFLILFGCGLPLNAQDLPLSDDLGTHFLVPMPDTVENKNGGTRITLVTRYELLLLSPTGANVDLVGPTGLRRSVTLSPEQTEVVSARDLFPAPMPLPIDPPGFRDPRVVSITSDQPIWLTVRVITPFGSETFRPVPVEAWGREYRLFSMRSWFVQSIGVDPATKEEGFEVLDVYPFCLIVASEDTTRITLSPSVPTAGPRQFILNAGEVTSLPITPKQGALDTAARDLTGGVITADKPIGVLSGNTRSHGGTDVSRLTELPGNSLQNLLVEWLRPTSSLGTSFVYTPIMNELDSAVEVIRIIPAEGNSTTVTTSLGGPAMTVLPGSFIELRVPGTLTGPVRTPFAIHADQKVMVAVVSGAEGIYTPNQQAGQGYGYLDSWGPAFTLLEPVEQWNDIVYGHGFGLPAMDEQEGVIVAEEGSAISIDGVPVELEPIPGTPFLHGRVTLEQGDHQIRSLGGRFSAIGYGIRKGFEAYLVPEAKEDDDKGVSAAHVTEYQEFLSIAWAAPLPGGVMSGEVEPDSIEISSREHCDSTVVTIARISDNIWSAGPLDVSLEDRMNVRTVIDAIAPFGPVTGYRVNLLPVDPARDASGRLVVRSLGVEKEYLYARPAEMVTLPVIVDFGDDVTAGNEVRRSITMINVRSFTGTVIDARVESGATGFGLDDGGLLPRPLQSGDSVTVAITFTGRAPSITWLDTLLVFTDCGVYRVPLRARTNQEEPVQALPTITGYDWGVRTIGSTNDTLSFAGNGGLAPYVVRSIQIVDQTSSPFSLSAPTHGNSRVAHLDTLPLGIRFQPPAPGSYVDTIRLFTEDGDSVSALLRGVAIDTTERFDFSVDDLQIDTVCAGDTLSYEIVLTNSGTNPVPFGTVVPIRTANLRLIDVRWPDGMTIPPSGTLRIILRVIADAPGPLQLLLGLNPIGANEGEVLTIVGTGMNCAPQELIVTDHDFGTLWVTTTGGGIVWLKNVGRGEVTVLDGPFAQNDENSFRTAGTIPPFVLQEGDSVPVVVRFTPMTVGAKEGSILFNTTIGPRVSQLTGEGKRLVVPAFIRRDYHGAPGEEVVVRVEIEEPGDTLFPDHLDYTVRFADDLLDFLSVVDKEGVTTPGFEFGEITGGVDRDPSDSLSAGTLVSLRFLVRLSLLEQTELPFEIVSPLPWLDFDERPGLFTRDYICALENRLFDFTRFGFSLGTPEPNPSSAEAELNFTIPFEARTTVVLYNLLGVEELRLVDEFLQPGPYQLTIPSTQLPVGVYILRFRSGTITGTRRVEIVR